MLVNETWDLQKNDYIRTPKRMIEFFEEIERICKKYNFSISHEDEHGSFIIEKFDEQNIQWLNHALKNYEEKR